jgi:hypothetical protein
MSWGIGTLILLFYNGVILGAIGTDYVLDGQGSFLAAWILPHGSIELPAIFIAGQAGLVLAHARLVAAMTGMAPLVLLDEIAAHFDPRRRAALYEELGRLGGQVWMTGADPSAFEGMGAGAQLFRVLQGQIAAA